MSTKNKTEDKLIESMRKNKTVAEAEKGKQEKQEKKDDKTGASTETKKQKTSVNKTADKTVFITSRRVWPD